MAAEVNSIGLVGDGDEWDFILHLENVFGVNFSDEELKDAENMGDILDVLHRKFPNDDVPGKCRTAMAFYRLRKPLKSIFPDKHIEPGTRLAELDGGKPKQLAEHLKENTELTLPEIELSGVAAWIVPISAFISFIAGMMLFIFLIGSLFESEFNWFLVQWSVLTCIVFGVVAVLVSRPNPGRWPENIKTYGELSEEVAALNFGQLTRAGGRYDVAELWEALKRATASSGETDPKLRSSQIGPNTEFYGPIEKKT